jgi:hypothetical protein
MLLMKNAHSQKSPHSLSGHLFFLRMMGYSLFWDTFVNTIPYSDRLPLHVSVNGKHMWNPIGISACLAFFVSINK